ncbi:ABC transporter substrate-binding protein [Psychrilyobacter atlanticus]|uniref:ABC transporter substrate-binding protein n=1 Tax=Psychrilyobacter atlanticus TaxID=271091 RepID=UPI000425CCC3|nr:ABC transporter substrate-binding protein [Psychrilyobacter atlanticus]
MKKTIFGILILLLMIGCGKEKKNGTSENGKKTKENTFIMGSANFNGDFYYGWTNSAYDGYIRKLIWGGGLLSPTDKGELVIASFVEKKETYKSDPKKKSDDVWKFEIKNGMTFSNGDPLTAKDVKFTYDFYMDKEALNATGGTSGLSEYIDRVELDEAKNSVTFYLKNPMYTVGSSIFFENQSILDSTMILAGVEKTGLSPQQWVKANISTPIGYGPYKIEKYVESQYVKLGINENYQGNFEGDKASIDYLIIQNIPSETQITQLITGEVDGLVNLGNEEDIEAILATPTLSTNNYLRNGGGQFTFHTDFGPMQLPEVRKAFAYEFNRVKFRDIFLGKYAISSNAPYSRNLWMMYDKGENLGTEGKFEKSLTNYDIINADGNWDKEANLRIAHKLLDQAATRTDEAYAKLTKDGNGAYLWDGKQITLNIATTPVWVDSLNLTLTKNIQDEFGIFVNIDSMDWSVLSKNLDGVIPLSERKYHAFTLGDSYGIQYDPYPSWSGTRVLPYGKGASTNGSRYRSNEELLNSIRFSNPSTTEGKTMYKANWRKWIVEVNHSLPILPLYSNNFYDAYTNKVVDFKTNALWEWPYAIVKAKFK